jgi:hypothetical protein
VKDIHNVLAHSTEPLNKPPTTHWPSPTWLQAATIRSSVGVDWRTQNTTPDHYKTLTSEFGIPNQLSIIFANSGFRCCEELTQNTIGLEDEANANLLSTKDWEHPHTYARGTLSKDWRPTIITIVLTKLMQVGSSPTRSSPGRRSPNLDIIIKHQICWTSYWRLALETICRLELQISEEGSTSLCK